MGAILLLDPPGLSVSLGEEFLDQGGAGDNHARGEEGTRATLAVHHFCSSLLGQYQSAGHVPGHQRMVEIEVDPSRSSIGQPQA